MADDGLPTLPTGEPVLARWFVIAMLVLVPLALVVTVWAVLAIPEGDLDPAQRRPPGTEEFTYDRGDVRYGRTDDAEPGPGCGRQVDLVGDEGARAAAEVAMSALCDVLRTPGMDEAREGLRTWAGGRLRFAVFERTGVESTTRLAEDGALVVELNAKFQFEDAARAAPVLVHELALLGGGEFPGRRVGARTALQATEAQLLACEAMGLLDEPDPPRGCRDAAALLEQDDPVADLVEAGFRDDR